jgi:hypothetical protein
MPTGNRATYVRDVAADEDPDQLLNDLKALTWEHATEHAVLELIDGRRVVVCGGRYGIDLIHQPLSSDPLGRVRGLYVEVAGTEVRVTRLEVHVHPEPTGPSDGDMIVLEILGQEASTLYELNGPEEGTVFRQKDR